MLGQIQPVLLYGLLPFQVPVPFSAVTGTPKYSKMGGHIDILARRKRADNRVRLSVWELKRPGSIEHAVFQSYIYAVTLRYMLRSSSGDDWFQLFGFSKKVPPSLHIESVVAVSESMEKTYRRQVKMLQDHNEMSIDQDGHIDRFILSVAFYEEATLQIKRFEVVNPPNVGG
jgi:hypothetical protein